MFTFQIQSLFTVVITYNQCCCLCLNQCRTQLMISQQWLVQLMTRWRQAISHYLIQCWPKYHMVTRVKNSMLTRGWETVVFWLLAGIPITFLTVWLISQNVLFIMRSWWHHQMETFSALLVICAGNSPVPDEFPTQRPVTRSFDIFFDLRLNKRLS